MEVQRQDSTLDTISGTLHTLAAQAGLIGQEVGEHTEYDYQPFYLVVLLY